MSNTNGNIPEMGENYLTVENIAPVIGRLQLQIIQLEAAIQVRDGVIAQQAAELSLRAETSSVS